MSRVLLDIKHHMCSGCCMWNGIEDVYCTKTGYEVPEGFLFMMASFAETVYLKRPSEANARFLSIGDGRPEHTYKNMKEILGLEYKLCYGSSFEKAYNSVVKQIESGSPVVLGPLDMYYLPYLKMYHMFHIPIHYVLMVGYDTVKECVLIYDCDRLELLELSVTDLKEAWNIEKNSCGKANGYVKFSFHGELRSPKEILDFSLLRKAKTQLCEKPKMIGISAYEKIAKDFPMWKKEMSAEVFRTTLMHLPEFWGKVPKVPNEMYGAPKGTEDIPYRGNMDRLADCISKIGENYDRDFYSEIAECFVQCGDTFQTITDLIIEYICEEKDTLSEIPDMFLNIGARMEKAYKRVLSKRQFETL